MKKKIVVLLSLLVALLCACGKTEMQSAEFDTVVKMDNFDVIVNSEIVTAEQLNGDKDHYEQFLTTDMTYDGLGGQVIVNDVTEVAKEGYVLAVISYEVKNTSQEQQKIDMPTSLNYNNGYIYDDCDIYYCIGTGGLSEWDLCLTNIDIAPLETIHFKAYFCVPEEVFSNTEAPLKWIMDNYEYTIR